MVCPLGVSHADAHDRLLEAAQAAGVRRSWKYEAEKFVCLKKSGCRDRGAR